MSAQDLGDMLKFVKTRKIKSSYGSYLSYVLKPKICHRQRTREKLIGKGNRKIENSLDLLTQLRSVQKLRLIEKLMFSKPQRILMTLHKQFLVDKSSSSEEQDKTKLVGFKIKSNVDRKIWHEIIPAQEES